MAKHHCGEYHYWTVNYVPVSGLHADSIRKQYGTRQILNDIFISCHTGELVGLLGRNGSGKSTLLKIIFGTLRAENRFVSVDQKKTGSLFAGRKLIRYLPQENFLPNHIKIRDLIRCFCSKAGGGLLINNSLIQPHLDKKAGQLSGGENRLVEILLMLHSDAKYLLLDEPFNGLSPLQVEVVKALIREHALEKGFIITDHDYRNVLDVSSRIVLMDRGNTKMIKDHGALIALGYLPESSASLF